MRRRLIIKNWCSKEHPDKSTYHRTTVNCPLPPSLPPCVSKMPVHESTYHRTILNFPSLPPIRVYNLYSSTYRQYVRMNDNLKRIHYNFSIHKLNYEHDTTTNGETLFRTTRQSAAVEKRNGTTAA